MEIYKKGRVLRIHVASSITHMESVLDNNGDGYISRDLDNPKIENQTFTINDIQGDKVTLTSEKSNHTYFISLENIKVGAIVPSNADFFDNIDWGYTKKHIQILLTIVDKLPSHIKEVNGVKLPVDDTISEEDFHLLSGGKIISVDFV